MKFNIKDLETLLISVENNNLESVKIKQPKFEILINKERRVIQIQQPRLLEPNNSIRKIIPERNQVAIVNNSSNLEKTANKQQAETYFTIVSPMVGTFYRSPSPNEQYFIELHDTVKTNQTVCIVEAMKLMNEIEAEVSGEIVEILVENGDIIDCGQALMKIKPAN